MDIATPNLTSSTCEIVPMRAVSWHSCLRKASWKSGVVTGIYRPPGIAVLGWNAQTQIHMVGHGMPPDPCKAHVIAECSQDLPHVLSERAKDCFFPLLRYDADVVSAIPPDVAVVLPCSPCGFSFLWPWRGHN